MASFLKHDIEDMSLPPSILLPQRLIDAISLLMMGTLLNDKEIIQTSAGPK